MPLVNDNEEDIQELKSDVSELQTAVNTQQNSINTLNTQMAVATSNISNIQSNVTTLTSQMAVANSNIANNQSNITNLNTRVTNCENNISNLTTQQTATSAVVNLLRSDVINFAIDLTQNTGQISTLETRVKALEDNPGGGGSSVPEYLIKSTVSPISDVFFNGTQDGDQKLIIRFFNPLPIDSHNELKAVAVKEIGTSDVKLYTATTCFVGYIEGQKAYGLLKNNTLITSTSLFNKNALYYTENYTGTNDNGVWGFGLNLPGNVKNSNVYRENNNELICFYDDTDSSINGTYTVTVDIELRTIRVEKDNILINNYDTSCFLEQIGGNALYMAFPEYEQNCTFSFEIQNQQPSNDVVMIHGILLKNRQDYYGSWSFNYNIANGHMDITTPDGNTYDYFMTNPDPEQWFACGNYQFAFMLRYDPGQMTDSFNFNFNGINTQYYDGTQALSSMGGSGDLFAYYNETMGSFGGSSVYFSSQNNTLEFQGQPENVSDFTEFMSTNPPVLFWTKKIDRSVDTTFTF